MTTTNIAVMGDVESNKSVTFNEDHSSTKESDYVNSNTSNNATKLTSSSDSSLDIVSLLWIYSGPVIFAVGLCGNALILVVMTRRRMSGTSTSVHLSLMAIADMAVLCTGLVPEWIEAAVGVIPKEMHPITCKLEKFLFYTSDYETFVRPWIALVTVNIIPFCVILFCNIFIIRALYQVQRMRSEQSIISASDKSMVQMTTMCLSASFCFLICITPSIVLLIGKPYWHKSSTTAYNVAKGINNQLVYVNHSVNFFLYCVTGRRFRQVIVSLCRVGQGARRRGVRYRGYGGDESGGTGADRTVCNSSEAVTMHLNSVGVTSRRPSPLLSAVAHRTPGVSPTLRGSTSTTILNGTPATGGGVRQWGCRPSAPDCNISVTPTVSIVVEMVVTTASIVVEMVV